MGNTHERFYFRLWDFDRNVWEDNMVQANEIIHTKNGALIQCVGEEDKNGKPIFEMDIVKWDNEHPHTKEILSSWGIVKWESGGFIIHSMVVHRPFYLPKYGSRQFHWDELEVMGNFYESKSLLQEIEALKGKA